jgi:hypothetical protein
MIGAHVIDQDLRMRKAGVRKVEDVRKLRSLGFEMVRLPEP